MSADYINIQSEKDKLAEENARLMDQLKKMRHRIGSAIERLELSKLSIRVSRSLSRPVTSSLEAPGRWPKLRCLSMQNAPTPLADNSIFIMKCM